MPSEHCRRGAHYPGTKSTPDSTVSSSRLGAVTVFRNLLVSASNARGAQILINDLQDMVASADIKPRALLCDMTVRKHSANSGTMLLDVGARARDLLFVRKTLVSLRVARHLDATPQMARTSSEQLYKVLVKHGF